MLAAGAVVVVVLAAAPSSILAVVAVVGGLTLEEGEDRPYRADDGGKDADKDKRRMDVSPVHEGPT